MENGKSYKVLVSGAGGFVGSAVCSEFIADSAEVTAIGRTPPRDGRVGFIKWDSSNSNPPQLDGYDVIVHLAAESVFGFWTKSKREKILKSRVDYTKKLAEAAANSKLPPKVFICASAVGYYGNRACGDESLPKGSGFLSDVCAAWEASTKCAESAGIRTVNLRFGIVINLSGGMVGKLSPYYRKGFGVIFGNGENMVSWVSLADAAGAALFARKQQHKRPRKYNFHKFLHSRKICMLPRAIPRQQSAIKNTRVSREAFWRRSRRKPDISRPKYFSIKTFKKRI